MRVIRFLLCCMLASLVFVLPCAADSPDSGPIVAVLQNPAAPAMSADMEKALAQLGDFAQKRLGLMRTNIRPHRTAIAVIQEGPEFIARYLDVDVPTMTTQIVPAQGSGAKYIGHMIYFEHIFESRGATKEEALAGEFTLVKMRHIRELFRYNRGKWID